MTAFFYDTHAHLTCETLLPVADRLVEEALHAGVERILVIATDSPSLMGALQLKEHFPETVRVAAARTPHDVTEHDDPFFKEIEQTVVNGQLAAIGETGLDQYNAQTPLTVQQTWMRRYLKLARKAQLPIVLHCRNAFKELISLLDEEANETGLGYIKGVLHCFTGNAEEAQSVLARGLLISLSGILTYKKNDELRLIAKGLPLNKLVIETDSPYLAPQSHRGKVNAPAYVTETGAYLAQLHGVTLSEVQRITTSNAVSLFGK